MLVGVGRKVRYARNAVVRERTAEFFLGNVGVGHGLDNVGTSDEHVRRVLHHHVEVRDRGTVNRAAGARAHDATDLRDYAARQGVTQKDVGITAEANHAFLDAGAARVVQTNNRNADLHRQVEHFADFFRVRL
jgi:hypothetical protein